MNRCKDVGRMADGQERRVHPRVPVGIIVKVHWANDSRSFYSKDISVGGVFLLAESPLLEETEVKLEMSMPFGAASIHAKGEVVWTTRQNPSGFAVQFTDITKSARELIRWVVERYLGRE